MNISGIHVPDGIAFWRKHARRMIVSCLSCIWFNFNGNRLLVESSMKNLKAQLSWLCSYTLPRYDNLYVKCTYSEMRLHKNPNELQSSYNMHELHSVKWTLLGIIQSMPPEISQIWPSKLHSTSVLISAERTPLPCGCRFHPQQ